MRLRNRIRKATYYTDPYLCRLHRDKREFYGSLWACAEDSCCLEDDMFGVKIAAWPSPLDADLTVELFEQWRDELIADRKLIPYEADGKRYLYIPTMAEHENPRNPQKPDTPLPTWVEWVGNEADIRKGKFVHSSYNDATTLPALPCPALSCPVPPRPENNGGEENPPPSFKNMPPCLSAPFEDSTLALAVIDSLGSHMGPTWAMKPTNVGKLGKAIVDGCIPHCNGKCATDCAAHLDAIFTKHHEAPALMWHCIANDPRPWAEEA